MLLKSTINEVAESQKSNLTQRKSGLQRDLLHSIPELSSHALIISGIRRCGKSTLLHQLLESKYKGAFYLNFEDPRLYEFQLNDFSRIDEIVKESNSEVLFFDEIQNINGWETYVRQKLDEGYKVVITGSNASLLSRKLGTKLTGRHITKELFPFSWPEYLRFVKKNSSESSLKAYMNTGGFPEYVKTGNNDILHQLFEDILIRDIAVRYGVRDTKSLQRLALYLISNVGKLVTANRVKSLIGISATSTVMEYFSHLEQSWLFQFIPKFSYSVRKQMINPRKVYAIDTGLVTVNSKSFTSDYGPLFENMVYLFLRRRFKEINYFSEEGECDFIAFRKAKPLEIMQVCYELTPDNLDRELNGLFEALTFFDIKKGHIITLNQSDRFERDGKIAEVVSCYDYFK
ncbi:MAG: ATP-binding protein [Balneolaceae bacterium]|nr:MAG: ATP-binding protein [Balneolaceae bacterium]